MRPQEKGIDLVIGLDVVEFLLTRACDVAVIVSLDRDLYEIPQSFQNLGRLIARPVRLEAAVPVPDGQKQPKILPRFSYTHQITRQVFAPARRSSPVATRRTVLLCLGDLSGKLPGSCRAQHGVAPGAGQPTIRSVLLRAG
jgi:hypothetical protein